MNLHKKKNQAFFAPWVGLGGCSKLKNLKK